MLQKVTKQECLNVLQDGGLSGAAANRVYNYFANDLGIEFLMLEFILSVQEEDPRMLGDLSIDLEEEANAH